ncbi:hypothetical protein GGI21_003492, partial [Coemansia aciculifera]
MWTTVVCALGAPEPVCAAAVSACSPVSVLEDSDWSSPFVVSGIDDLLLELGVADAALIADIDISEDLLLLGRPPTIPMFGADSDVLSLREIDELIEQLGHSHSASHIGCHHLDQCELSKRNSRTLYTPATLDISALVSDLGCVADIVSAAATTTATLSAERGLVIPPLDPASIVAELGRAGALAFLLPPMPTPNVGDIVRQLGDASLASQLVPLPLQAENHAPVLDVDELITELGRMIEPELACPLDICEMVKMLGSPMDAIRAALMQTTATAGLSLAKGLMRTPDPGTAVSLAGLGGVYTSEWLVRDMDQDAMTGERMSVDSSLATYSFIEFPPIPLQSSVPTTVGVGRMSSELEGTGMDVDEVIIEQSDGTQYINRLIAALRIPPIV